LTLVSTGIRIMAHSEKETQLSAKTSDLTTQSCPPVADLIDFALGRNSIVVADQVRNHLLIDNCNCCRSWVDQAMLHRTGPAIDWMKMNVGPLRPISSSTPSSDPTPVPENAKWQRRAFRDLEARLGLLESN
jgi:hypothetical protein